MKSLSPLLIYADWPLPGGNNLWIGHVLHSIDLMDIKTRKVVKHYDLLKDNHTVKKLSTVRATSKVLREGEIYWSVRKTVFFATTISTTACLPPVPAFLPCNSLCEDRAGRYGRHVQPDYYFNNTSQQHRHVSAIRQTQYPTAQHRERCLPRIDEICGSPPSGALMNMISNLASRLHYTVKNGMPSNVAFRILPDENNCLWIRRPMVWSVSARKRKKIMTYAGRTALSPASSITTRHLERRRVLYFDF